MHWSSFGYGSEVGVVVTMVVMRVLVVTMAMSG